MQRKMTVSELAERLGKTPGYISRLEVRGEKPSPDLVFRIADLLRIPPEQLVKLAKDDLLEGAEKDNDRRFAEAEVLYRRSK
jgi:transcriptional regulator with XRE-family HTH domain